MLALSVPALLFITRPSEAQGAVSRSVRKYLIVRSPYDNELVTLLTVRNMYVEEDEINVPLTLSVFRDKGS